MSGVAWFDDLCLIELPDQTQVDDLSYSEPEYLTPELKSTNLLANSGFEEFAVLPTKGDSYRCYVEILVALSSGDLELADDLLEEALQEESAMDRDGLFALASATATFAEASGLSEVRRHYWLDQTIRLLEVWSSDSDMDRSLIRDNPDFAGLRENHRFIKVAAERKVIPAGAYWLASREVTRGEYESFLDDTNDLGDKPKDAKTARHADFVSPTLDHPARDVSWYDAVMYCNWLSRREGRTAAYRSAGKEKVRNFNNQEVEVDKWEEVDGSTGYRLPGELEWEYACRAGTTTEFSSGDDEGLLVTYSQMYPSKLTAPCGEKLPNAWGLHDVHGNVAEWCWDLYDSQGSLRVLRGGGWKGAAAHCRTAIRDAYEPALRGTSFGFRLALSLPSGQSPEADTSERSQ